MDSSVSGTQTLLSPLESRLEYSTQASPVVVSNLIKRLYKKGLYPANSIRTPNLIFTALDEIDAKLGEEEY